MGILIEKCTEIKPERRPAISVLRPMLLEILVELGGHCKVADEKSEQWLEKLNSIDTWTPDEFDDFARFFAQIDLTEREDKHENEWVYTLSTPFLTRLPTSALVKISKRRDGVSSAVIEKFCEWARTTAFLFHYADTVGGSLAAIFDDGDAATKALSMTALLALGESHNRWYVMRKMLHRCSADSLTNELARRLAIEIRTEEMVPQFCRCVNEASWDVNQLAPELARLCA